MRDFQNHDLVDDIAKPGVRHEAPSAAPDGSVAGACSTPGSRSTTRRNLTSYTTDMVKGVILAMRRQQRPRGELRRLHGRRRQGVLHRRQHQEYAEYYAGIRRYRQYMRLFNDMVSAILACDKPVICRVNGMRIGGGQEIGMACDFSVAQDLALRQAGPSTAAAPIGGATDFLPLVVGAERAMAACVLCEPFSAHKATRWAS